jgi:hypothetical protein
MDPSDAVHFWSSDTMTLMDDLTLIRLGGHFPGSTVARWSGAADGKAVILSGDTIQVCMDRKSVSFMYSFPNYIPVSPSTVNHIVNSLSSYEFERVYGGFEDRRITSNAKAIVETSAKRYVEHVKPNLATESSNRPNPPAR